MVGDWNLISSYNNHFIDMVFSCIIRKKLFKHIFGSFQMILVELRSYDSKIFAVSRFYCNHALIYRAVEFLCPRHERSAGGI